MSEGASPVKVSTPLGGACTLLGCCFIGTYAAYMLVQWRANNTLTQRSLDMMAPDTWGSAMGLPWATMALPGVPSASGLLLRLTVDGDPGSCAAPLAEPAATGLLRGKWAALPGTVDCSGSGAGGASQLTYACQGCDLAPGGASVSLLLHYSCQSLLLEVAGVPAAYPSGSAWFGSATAAGGPNGTLLSALQWTVTPVLTLLRDNVGVGGSKRGYAISLSSLQVARQQPQLAALSVMPLAAALNVTVLLPLSATYVSTTVVEITPITQLLANIVGLGGLLSWFAWLYATVDSRSTPRQQDPGGASKALPAGELEAAEARAGGKLTDRAGKGEAAEVQENPLRAATRSNRMLV